MGLFSKRETVTQNMAYLALMAAINVIFVLLTAIFQPLMFIMIFVLPLTSTVVTLFCKKRFFPIYLVVTVGLCLLITSWASIFDTFFYVLPSMISGFIFGVLIEKRVGAIYIIAISTVVQYALTILTFFTLNAILTDINFIDVLLKMLGLGNFGFKDYFASIFLFLLAIIQTIITYVVIKYEIVKLGFEINLDIGRKYILNIINLGLFSLAIIMFFVYGPLAYIAIFVNLIFIAYEVGEIILLKSKLLLILIGLSLLTGLLLFIGFNSQITKPLQFTLLSTSFVLISAIYFANYLFRNKTNSTKIE